MSKVVNVVVAGLGGQGVVKASDILADAGRRAMAKARITDGRTEAEYLRSVYWNALGEPERFFALNERFHLRLLALDGNRWRAQMVTDLRKVMKLNRHASLFQRGRIDQSLAEHDRIVQALLRRDGAAASAAVQAHFASGLQAASHALP